MNKNGNPEMVTMTYREAVRAGIREAMLKDERVFLMGEDVESRKHFIQTKASNAALA